MDRRSYQKDESHRRYAVIEHQSTENFNDYQGYDIMPSSSVKVQNNKISVKQIHVGSYGIPLMRMEDLAIEKSHSTIFNKFDPYSFNPKNLDYSDKIPNILKKDSDRETVHNSRKSRSSGTAPCESRPSTIQDKMSSTSGLGNIIINNRTTYAHR